jgi:hypothetical protein
MTHDRRTISLPADLCDAVEQRFGGRFETVESLLEAVLQELLQDKALQMDEHEQMLIEQRLKALGYV